MGRVFEAVEKLNLPTYTIESLDQEGRGIARRDGKTIFIEGALTGETVTASVYRKKPSFENALVQNILRESSQRVTPQCVNFGNCGGCSLQHLDARAQVAAKQRVLEDNLRHIGKVTPGQILPPLYGPAWGYRRRAHERALRPQKGWITDRLSRKALQLCG